VRWVHWLLVGAFTLLTLRAGRGERAESGPGNALFSGALILVMILSSPVCHTHYFVLCIPLVMGLYALHWESLPAGIPTTTLGSLSVGLFALFTLQILGHTLPQLSQLQIARDNGAALYTALVLWWVGCRALRSPGREVVR
jgi:hypothetical protein